MLEKIIIFVLFLGPLVFFHELGHYLFARLFGVRVEVFSIGFGPKLIKFKRGFTEYAVSLIPLGGYVKMFGDDPLNKDQIAIEDRKHSFTFKGKFARFCIVFGGPLANFILAYCIFFSLLMGGEKVPEIKVGQVQEGSVFFEKGFRTGDVIKKVNGNTILNPADIALQQKPSVETITVARNGSMEKFAVGLKVEEFFRNFSKHPPVLRRPILVNKFGKYFAISTQESGINWDAPIESLPYSKKAGTYYLFPLKDKERTDSKEIKVGAALEDRLILKSSNIKDFVIDLNSKGYWLLDMEVKSVNMNSPADKAGIRSKDIILSLDGIKVYTFNELRENLQKTKNKTVEVSVLHNGKVVSTTMTPDIKEIQGQTLKLIGVYSNGAFQGLKMIQTKSKGLSQSFVMAFARTWDAIVKTASGFKKLITGEVSVKQIGGPFAIGKVASDSFNMSLSYFFQLMALISVNLGLINLFPIPVLDGGHIMFIALEILNGGPISRRKMEIAQQIGLSFLLMLMVGAIFNDITNLF